MSIGLGSPLSRRRAVERLTGGVGLLALAGWASTKSFAAAPSVTFAAIARSNFPLAVQSLQLGDRDGAAMVDAGNAPLDPAGRGYWWTTSNDGKRVWRIQPTAVMTPEMFGTIPNNAGDAAPAINAAARFLAAAGGGTLKFRPSKVYRLASIDPSTARGPAGNRASIAFPADARNLRFEFNGATLLQVADAYSFGPGYAELRDKQVLRSVRPLARPASRGDTSVQMAGPTDDIRPGDCVILIAGNSSLENATVNYTPIAELLLVASVSGRTIGFTEPLAKDYTPDRRNPFGLIPANDLSIRNCALIGPARVINRFRRTGNVIQAYGFEFRDIRSEGRGGFNLRGRHIQAFNTTSILQPDWSPPLFRPYALAIDMGSCDVLIDGLNADGGSNVAILHLHEAIADLVARNITIRNGTTPARHAEPWAAISITGTSWNVTISNATVINNPQGAGLEAREAISNHLGNAGLKLSNLRFEGEFNGPALLVNDRNPPAIDGVDLTGARRNTRGELMVILGSAAKAAHVIGLAG